MISLDYFCTHCAIALASLNDAQAHSNSTSHHISIKGFLTPTELVGEAAKLQATQDARNKLRDAQILRLARDKGLLK